jgi:XTP/dITP diphosphohydrolase
MKIVLATRNPNKVREIEREFGGLPMELVPASDLAGAPEVVEDGQTLEENAARKARALADFSGLPAMADDTGLFVYALNDRPGVQSSRYAGPEGDAKKNTKKLLIEMKHVPPGKRNATFRTVIAVCVPGEADTYLSGEVRGTILTSPRGKGGFGYDPVFVPDGFDKTFAEMTLEEKNAISHRGIAIRKTREWLAQRF